MKFPSSKALLPLIALPFLMAHGDGGCGCGDDEGFAFGPPTETTCPSEGTTLTYENFAAPFFASYCQRCHSRDVEGADRQGAPADHNFDSKLEAIALKDHIDWTTGSGPAATNELMPPNGDAPSLEERKNLSLWLACDSI